MILEKVKKTIGLQLGIGEEKIKEDTTFEDLGIDSLEIVEIIIALEEEFDIVVPTADIKTITNMNSLTKYIQNKLDLKLIENEKAL